MPPAKNKEAGTQEAGDGCLRNGLQALRAGSRQPHQYSRGRTGRESYTETVLARVPHPSPYERGLTWMLATPKGAVGVVEQGRFSFISAKCGIALVIFGHRHYGGRFGDFAPELLDFPFVRANMVSRTCLKRPATGSTAVG